MNSTKEEEVNNNVIPQAQAPIPSRELNETMFREEEAARKEMANQEEKEIIQEEELFLPPSQKGKDNIVLDEVIGMSVNNPNEYHYVYFGVGSSLDTISYCVQESAV